MANVFSRLTAYIPDCIFPVNSSIRHTLKIASHGGDLVSVESDVIVPQSSLFDIYAKAGPIAQTWILRATHILFPDLNESIPEFLNAECINDGIDSGVAMTEQDSHVKKAH